MDSELIFRSKLPPIAIPKHLPLHSYCFERLSDVSSRPCLIDGATGEVLTYSDVDLASRRIAAAFHRTLGIRKRDVIMLLLPNAPEFILAFLAASRLGAVITAANPLHTAEEVSKHARAAGSRILITESGNFSKARSLLDDGTLTAVVFLDDPPPEAAGMKCHKFSELAAGIGEEDELKELSEVEIEPEDVVAMPFSSGTTGLPKGVLLTHRGKVTSVAQQVDGENPNVYMQEEDVMLCVLPLFHIYSLNITLCALRVGAAVLVLRRFEMPTVLRLMERHRVTVAPMVPTIVLAIAKSSAAEEYDLSSVRMVKCGAAPLGKDLEDSIKSKFPNAKFGQGYGMTEAGPVLAMSLGFAKEAFEVKSGACGTVVRNAEMKIVDPESGAALPRNCNGEICIRGDQIMKGYLNDAAATERTIDKEGWLHTGDVGYIDDDDEVFIVDRLKEMIKYKGFQVAPAELEALLLGHPDISDAAVVGMKDEVAGEIPVAFVVRSKASEMTEEEIKKFVSKRVVFYKRISRVFFVESIPKGPSGKILRKDLRARLTAETPQ